MVADRFPPRYDLRRVKEKQAEVIMAHAVQFERMALKERQERKCKSVTMHEAIERGWISRRHQ